MQAHLSETVTSRGVGAQAGPGWGTRRCTTEREIRREKRPLRVCEAPVLFWPSIYPRDLLVPRLRQGTELQSLSEEVQEIQGQHPD